MSYRLGFDGAPTPTTNQLLTAIEHRLNGHASADIATEDPPSSATQVSIPRCANGQLPPCPYNDPHGPWFIVAHGPGLFFGALAVAFAAGFGVAMMLVQRKLKAR